MAPTIKTLYAFTEKTFIENITIRRNGHLIFTTFRDGSVFGIDPNAVNPEAHLLARLPPKGDHCIATGIVEVSPDVFVITSGLEPTTMVMTSGSIAVSRLDLSEGVAAAKVEQIAAIPAEAAIANGLANIPEAPHILFSVDSGNGRVYRINATSGAVDMVLEDESLKPAKDPFIPMGVNGAKCRDGYLYVTNSTRQQFSRYKIDIKGNITSGVEILVDNPPGSYMPYDDFAFDQAGNAYVGVHPKSVYKIEPGGAQSLLAGGEGCKHINSPTSCVVGGDDSRLYVTCAGQPREWHGSIVEVSLA